LSTSAVTACCSRASFSSRVRAATCSWRSAADASVVGALRALGLTVRQRFTDCLLLPRRCMSPRAVHDDAQSYANPSFFTMAACPLWVISRHLQRTNPCPLYPRWICQHGLGLPRDARNRCDIADEIEIELLVERGVDCVR